MISGGIKGAELLVIGQQGISTTPGGRLLRGGILVDLAQKRFRFKPLFGWRISLRQPGPYTQPLSYENRDGGKKMGYFTRTSLDIVRLTFFCAPAIAIATFFGCGGRSDVAYVEGRVTLDGQPLANATVLFIPQAGRPASGVTDSNGRYVLEYEPGKRGAPVGTCRVQITTARGETVGPDRKPIPPVPEKVPMRYNVKTELSVVVEAGKSNKFDFDLKSGGPVARTVPA
ncbi:MAG: carboxypeptidase-like regulatory domain-containing protein [Thermoguttaceae bacterium]|nr:carboxypeptidase-like regulatory domain-containing protein [Thermoguttaceae bacterium]MDW8077252.1 carboxypeptidase-like regulatory domain-containing protein [Thermoguttaceae bacterium]